MAQLTPIYLAASSSDTARVRALADNLERHGCRVTYRWWDDVDRARAAGIADAELPPHEAARCARNDKRGVQTSGVLVYYNYAPSRGASFETGIAMGVGIPILELSDTRSIWQELDGWHTMPLASASEHVAAKVHELFQADVGELAEELQPDDICNVLCTTGDAHVVLDSEGNEGSWLAVFRYRECAETYVEVLREDDVWGAQALPAHGLLAMWHDNGEDVP